MRSLTLLFFLLFIPIVFLQCQTEKQDKEALLQQIENRLQPGIIIAGKEDASYFNIHERMRHHKVPGLSIAFVNNGEIEWTACYGYLSQDSLQRVDSLTLFQAASISKPVAAMAALKLVEEGRLSLQEDVNKYLKGWQVEASRFTEGKPVTLEGLLTHSAGLTVHGFRGYAEGEEVPNVLQVLNGEKPANSDKILPDTFPGSLWRYSGGGYTLMQKVAEDVTGKPFPEVMEEMVLSRIGMAHSTYEQPLPERLHARASIGHRGGGAEVEGRWHTYPEMAAAGLWTTPSDLARYLIEVQKSLRGRSNKILSQEMTKEMLSKHLGDWGLGPAISGEGDSLRFGHGGANEGYRCRMIAFANLGQGVVLMTNSDNGTALGGEVLRSISQAYGWGIASPPEIKKVVELTAEQLQALSGKYRANEQLVVKFTVEDGRLMAQQLWDEAKYEIYPESELDFFELDEGVSFTFEKGEDGKITGFSVFNGAYRFEKVEE